MSSESLNDVPVAQPAAVALKPSLTNKPKLPTASAPPMKSVSSNGSTTNGSGSSPTGIRVLRPESYVGFDSLPDQFVSRIVRSGFVFNILALGATGIGKTTLFESLFNTKLSAENLSTRTHGKTSVEVASQQIELNEGLIKLKLTLIESKGFGDQIDKSEYYQCT